MPAAWPTNEQFLAWLYAANLIDTNPPVGRQLGIDYVAAMAQAIEAWHNHCHRDPFLAEAGPTTRYYSPFNADILPIAPGWFAVTSVKTGYSPSYAGNALTENVDYWLCGPKDAGPPYDYIKFREHQTGDPKSIVVVGRRGYSDTIPQEVFDAVMRRAAGVVLPALDRIYRGGVTEHRAGDESEKFGGDGTSDTWASTWPAALASYQRFRMG